MRYVYPILRRIIELWFFAVEILNEQYVRYYSGRLCGKLPLIWHLKSSGKIGLGIKVFFFVIMMYSGVCFSSCLSFGFIFDLYITVFLVVLLVKTSWDILDAVDYRMHPFILMMLIQNFFLPTNSIIYLSLVLLATAIVYPYVDRLLTSSPSERLMDHFQLMNFRAYLELDTTYRQFFAEVVNVLISIYMTHRAFVCCCSMNISSLFTLVLISCLWLYCYTKLIYLIAIQPNFFLFIISSVLFSRFILHLQLSNRYSLLMGILLIYFAFLYPSIYLLIRRSTLHFSNRFGLRLKFVRRQIRTRCLPSFLRYHSKNFLFRSISLLGHLLLLCSFVLFL